MPVLRRAIYRGLKRLCFWFTHWENCEGIQIGVVRLCDHPAETALRIRQAVALICSVAPFRLTRIQREVQRVWVFPMAYNLAEWDGRYRMCVLNPEFVNDSTTTIANIAATLIHEATHGRLERLGFQYSEDRRVAIERVCFMEEIRFARRLPDGEDVIRGAESQIERPSTDWTDASMNEAKLDGLRQTSCPRWLVRLVERRIRPQ